MIWFSLIFHTPPAFFHISQCSRFGEKRMWSLTENWTRSWCACAFAKSNRHPRHRTQVELRLAGPSSLRWLWNSACASVLRKSRSMSFSLCWASDRPEQKDGADTTVPSKLALQKHRIQHTIEFNCSRSHLACNIIYVHVREQFQTTRLLASLPHIPSPQLWMSKMYPVVSRQTALTDL